MIYYPVVVLQMQETNHDACMASLHVHKKLMISHSLKYLFCWHQEELQYGGNCTPANTFSFQFIAQMHGKCRCLWRESYSSITMSSQISGSLSCIFNVGPRCNSLCYGILCYAMLCYAMLCYAMLCYSMLCYAMLCYACYAMLCYAMYTCICQSIEFEEAHAYCLKWSKLKKE